MLLLPTALACVPSPNVSPLSEGMKQSESGFFGYTFCGSGGDVCRFRHFLAQLYDADPTNDARAIYYLNIIAWDYGLTPMQFIFKYGSDDSREAVEYGQAGSTNFNI